MKIKRRMLEALAGIQNYITHGINTKDCPACPRWDELQISVMEAIAALEAADARKAKLRKRVAELEGMVPKWVPVSERLPEVAGEYLTIVNGIRGQDHFDFDDDEEFPQGYFVNYSYDTSHWLSGALPAAPVSPSGEKEEV